MTVLYDLDPAGGGGGVEKDWIFTDLKNKTSSRVRILNDYLGNMNAVQPRSVHLTHFHNGYFVFNVQLEDLMEDIEKRLAERSCTEKDREILNKTLSKLKEGTNNVVFFGKLKDDITTKLW